MLEDGVESPRATVESCLMWVLRTELRSPGKTVGALCFVLFQDRVSLCSPGCPGAHFVDQAGLELRNPPASCLPSAGVKGVRHHCLASIIFIIRIKGLERWLSG